MGGEVNSMGQLYSMHNTVFIKYQLPGILPGINTGFIIEYFQIAALMKDIESFKASVKPVNPVVKSPKRRQSRDNSERSPRRESRRKRSFQPYHSPPRTR